MGVTTTHAGSDSGSESEVKEEPKNVAERSLCTTQWDWTTKKKTWFLDMPWCHAATIELHCLECPFPNSHLNCAGLKPWSLGFQCWSWAEAHTITFNKDSAQFWAQPYVRHWNEHHQCRACFKLKRITIRSAVIDTQRIQIQLYSALIKSVSTPAAIGSI